MQCTSFLTYEVGGYSVQVQNRGRICVMDKTTRFGDTPALSAAGIQRNYAANITKLLRVATEYID